MVMSIVPLAKLAMMVTPRLATAARLSVRGNQLAASVTEPEMQQRAAGYFPRLRIADSSERSFLSNALRAAGWPLTLAISIPRSK